MALVRSAIVDPGSGSDVPSADTSKDGKVCAWLPGSCWWCGRAIVTLKGNVQWLVPGDRPCDYC